MKSTYLRSTRFSNNLPLVRIKTNIDVRWLKIVNYSKVRQVEKEIFIPINVKKVHKLPGFNKDTHNLRLIHYIKGYSEYDVTYLGLCFRPLWHTFNEYNFG